MDSLRSELPEHSIEEGDLISGTECAFCKDCGVDSDLSVAGMGYVLHDCRIGFGGVGIEGDHLAAGIAFKDRKGDFFADTERMADELIFDKPVRCVEVEIEIGTEAPFVEGDSKVTAELLDGLQGEERDRATVGEGAFGTHEVKLMSFAKALLEQVDECGIVDGMGCAIGGLNIDEEIVGVAVDGGDAGRKCFGLVLIRRFCRMGGVAKEGLKEQHMLAFTGSEVGESSGSGGIAKGVDAISIDTGEACKGALQLFSSHTFDRVAPEAFNRSNDVHGGVLVEEQIVKRFMRRLLDCRLRISAATSCFVECRVGQSFRVFGLDSSGCKDPDGV